MLPFAHSATQNTVQTLREGIKTKYSTYHLRDKDRYPDFAFNSNRANYQPLKDSFEEEFYEVRKIDRTSPNVNIPSTNTLALIFSDNAYVPGIKILNTCESYALGPTKSGIDLNVPDFPRSELLRPSRVNLFIGGFLLLCLGAILLAKQIWFGQAPSGLVIVRPVAKSIVSEEVIIEGKATNANVVWLAVKPKATGLVWIQRPILVQNDGVWIGLISVGNSSKFSEGSIHQIRAFINPSAKLSPGDILVNWPEAELSSKVIDVVRGPNHP